MSARNSRTAKAVRREARAVADHRRTLQVMTTSGWAPTVDEIEVLAGELTVQMETSLGDRIDGEVKYIVEAGQDAVRHLNTIRTPMARAAETPVQRDYYRRLHGQLREYGGIIVTAIATVRPLPPEPALPTGRVVVDEDGVWVASASSSWDRPAGG